MTIDWGSKKGLAMGFNSDAAEPLKDYHPKGDGYHFVNMVEDTSSGESVFKMETSNIHPDLIDSDYHIQVDDDLGWDEEPAEVISLLELRRDENDPDVLVGSLTDRFFKFGYSLIGWRIEMQKVDFPTGDSIEVAIDTLTWQRQNQAGEPSDLNGNPLPQDADPLNITTSWIWRIVYAEF